jgi:hypothetical protein
VLTLLIIAGCSSVALFAWVLLRDIRTFYLKARSVYADWKPATMFEEQKAWMKGLTLRSRGNAMTIGIPCRAAIEWPD